MMRQILFSLFFSMMCAMSAAAAKAYAVTNWFTPDSITMTFYYDDLSNNYEQRPGEHWFFFESHTQPSWYQKAQVAQTTKVIFDASFANARPTTTAFWFHNMTHLTSITGLQYLNTSEVTSMSEMFYNCESLTSLDLSHFNTANVTNMREMFHGCTSLTSLDLSHFNTANVISMYNMFCSCRSLTSLDLSSFNTANVTNMYQMFGWCNKLSSLDLSSFNTAKVAIMSNMFWLCPKLTSLDLSSFNTANVTDMDYMFYGSDNLTTIYVGDTWSTAAVTESMSMFGGCKSLVGGLGTTYDSNHSDKEYAHVDGGIDNPGYLSCYDSNLFYHAGLWYKIEKKNTNHNELTVVRPQLGHAYSGEVDIPDAFSRNGTVCVVTGIGQGAFTRTAVTAVTLPATVTRIESRAFYGAQNLKSLILTTEEGPNKHTLGTDFVGDNASGFACYVKNNLLPAWQLRYPSFNFLPWEVTRENGFLTFSCVRDVALPEGLSAYTVTGFNTAQRMATSTKLTDRNIPANNGVVLKGSPSTRYLFLPPTSTPSMEFNMLMPLNVIEDIPYAPFAANPDDSKAYFLDNNCDEWRQFQNSIDLFMKLNTGIAYLAVDKSLLGEDYTSPVQLDLWCTPEYPVGDVDGDGKVDVTDVNAVINIILKVKHASDYPGNPDVDGDTKVDVSDVNAIINIILKVV